MTIIDYVLKFIELLQILILIRVVMTWFDVREDSPLGRIIYTLTQPLYNVVYKIFSRTVYAMIDFTPVLAIGILIVIQELFIMIIKMFI